MYLSLAYFLKYGRFVEDHDHPNIWALRDFSNYNELYNFSTHVLSPYEECNCYRHKIPGTKGISKEGTIENRYFADPERNNYITYIQMFGSYPPHGHWTPAEVHSSKHVKPNFTYPLSPFVWRYDWGGLIREYLAKLEHKPQYLVFNEGLWVEHELRNAAVRQSIKDALDETGIIGIYKTTTLPHFNTANSLMKIPASVVCNRHDKAMCDIMDGRCLDLSWTKYLGREHKWDRSHFTPHVNKVMVLQFLEMYNSLLVEKQEQKQN